MYIYVYIGLDSSACVSVLACLRELTELGLTVVTVIHQPRFCVISMFHELMLLGSGGQMVYFGPVCSVLPYFHALGFELPANENPCDFCLDVITGVIPREGDPNFQPSDLFELWKHYEEEIKKNNNNNISQSMVQHIKVDMQEDVGDEGDIVNNNTANNPDPNNPPQTLNNATAIIPPTSSPRSASSLINREGNTKRNSNIRHQTSVMSVFQPTSPVELIQASPLKFGSLNYRPSTPAFIFPLSLYMACALTNMTNPPVALYTTTMLEICITLL